MVQSQIRKFWQFFKVTIRWMSSSSSLSSSSSSSSSTSASASSSASVSIDRKGGIVWEPISIVIIDIVYHDTEGVKISNPIKEGDATQSDRKKKMDLKIGSLESWLGVISQGLGGLRTGPVSNVIKLFSFGNLEVGTFPQIFDGVWRSEKSLSFYCLTIGLFI